MDKIMLEARKRTEIGKQNTRLRAAGQVPAITYGHGAKPQPITVEGKLLERVYKHAGGNKIIGLKVDDGSAKNVLIHDVQHDALTGALTHVDFFLIRMDEVLQAEIPLHFVGESTAVYQGEGTLVKNLETVEVECLPADLPESLEVDIAVLDDFEKTITAADLAIPQGVKLLLEEPSEMLVAKVEPPRSEEEMADLDEVIDEAAELPEGVAEEDPIVVSEENEGSADRRDKK